MKVLAFVGLAGVRHSRRPWGIWAGWGQCPDSRVSVILLQGRLLRVPAPDRVVHLPSLAAQLFWNNLQAEIVLAFPWELFVHSFSLSLLSSSSPANAADPLTLKTKGHIPTAGSTGRALCDDGL